MMNIITRKVLAMIKRDKIKIDELGRQIAYLLSNKKKRVLIITICRILLGNDQGIYTSLSQYNQRKGKVNMALHYRKEIFNSII